MATSAPLGTTFDAAGRVGHILNPLTGLAGAAQWRGVSISAPSAALADALSTAACLMEGPHPCRPFVPGLRMYVSKPLSDRIFVAPVLLLESETSLWGRVRFPNAAVVI
ncbi:FAD:protein FMN transferase [Gemmobacter lanyuensis]